MRCYNSILKVGIIGCGGVAPSHIKAYKKLGLDLVGLCDINIKKAKGLASKFCIKKVYDNYFDMFENNRLDLIDICTPVSTHKQIVCDAARYVPAILVEKPMALTVAECDEMIKEIRKHGSDLCIGHNQIFSPLIQRAKLLVDSGDFNLLSFRTTQRESYELLKLHNLAPAWNVDPEQRGIIWEVCCHLAYLQLYFLPEIREVYAVGGKTNYPVYDDFTVLLRTRDDTFGLIELSWVSHESEIVYELRDSSGKRIQILRDFNYLFDCSTDPPFTVGKVVRNILTDQKRLLRKWMSFGLCYLRNGKMTLTLNLISKYIQSIRNDLPPPVTPEEGRNTINLLECIEKSLDEKCLVRLSNGI